MRLVARGARLGHLLQGRIARGGWLRGIAQGSPQGIGASLTSVLAFRGADVLSALGVPEGEGWQMACCVTFGYPTGRWGVAPRRPVHEVSYRNRWGQPLGFEIPEPRDVRYQVITPFRVALKGLIEDGDIESLIENVPGVGLCLQIAGGAEVIVPTTRQRKPKIRADLQRVGQRVR